MGRGSGQNLVEWVRAIFARPGRMLFEPSPLVTDISERRRARLLAKLELIHVLQLAIGVVMILVMNPPDAPHRAPAILSTAMVLIGGAYLLARTRFLRQSIWSYIVVASLISAVVALFSARPMKNDMFAILSISYLLPPVLLASVMSTARKTLVTGALALTVTLIAMKISGNFTDVVEGTRQGCFFFITCVVLVVVFSIHRDNVQADKAAELQTRNVELEALRQSLEQRVAERTSALSQRNGEMRLVLDHVAQGIFTIDEAGRMAPEHSAVLSRWFGPPDAGELFHQFLGRVDPDFGDSAEVGWQQVVDGILPLAASLAQLPTSLAVGPRHYCVSYEAIDPERVGRFLIVVSDVTSDVERERSQREKKETLAVFEHLLADRGGFLQFIDETTEIVASLGKPNVDLVDRKRALHTLKGNSLLMGIHSISEICQRAETRLEEEHHLSPDDLRALSERWARLASDIEIILGSRKGSVEVSRERHQALAQTTKQGASPETVARMVDELIWEPAEPRLRLFADHANRLAARFGKQVQVAIDHEGLHFDRRPWSKLWACFVHVIRNAVDHGIEAPDEREKHGKPRQGRITLRGYQDGANTVLEVEDDGNGVDWEAIRGRCLARGLPASSHDDLLAGLFADGVSTARAVTDISGRGIGMGAVRAAVLSLGGTLRVVSERGRGTTMRMIFPPDPVLGMGTVSGPAGQTEPRGAVS